MAIDKAARTKLRDDLQAGVITPEQFDEGIDRLENQAAEAADAEKRKQAVKVRIDKMAAHIRKWAEDNIADESKRSAVVDAVEKRFIAYSNSADEEQQDRGHAMFHSLREVSAECEAVAKEQGVDTAPKKDQPKPTKTATDDPKKTDEPELNATGKPIDDPDGFDYSTTEGEIVDRFNKGEELSPMEQLVPYLVQGKFDQQRRALPGDRILIDAGERPADTL